MLLHITSMDIDESLTNLGLFGNKKTKILGKKQNVGDIDNKDIILRFMRNFNKKNRLYLILGQN